MYLNIQINTATFTIVYTLTANYRTERSFSHLKEIKTYLPSQITKERIKSLAILTIESNKSS